MNSKELRPNHFNISLAELKGLATNNKLNSKYYLLMSIYYKYLEEYLNEALNIKNIESEIDRIHPDYTPINKNEKDIYQKLSNNKYLYIRNTLYIEKIPVEYIEYLYNQKDNNSNEKTKKIIQETFKQVITSGKEQDHYRTNYGPLTNNLILPNDSLIIGFRVSDEDEKKYGENEEWLAYKNSKLKFIDNLIEKLSKYFSSILKMDVRVIDYSEYEITINNEIEQENKEI